MQKITVLETDFKQKYLIKTPNNDIFYCGEIMKDIIIPLNQGKKISEIADSVNFKHKKEYTESEIEQSLYKLKNSKCINNTSFKPILEFIDSQKIPAIKISFLKNKYFFITLVITSLVTNFYFYININTCDLDTYDTILKFSSILVILLLHEIGHSFFAKQYNIKTGKIGLGVYLYVIPVFYINLNEIWCLKKEKRVVINLGGIFFQLIIGIILIIVYQIEKSNIIGSLIKTNTIIAMLNFNPFIKFDGYWVLADLLNNKDLYSQSNQAIKKWFHFKAHKYSKTVTIYSIGRIFFCVLMSYILIKIIFSLWN